MVSLNATDFSDLDELYSDATTFERIRPQRETPMPVGSTSSKSKGRRRSSPPKRTHRTPSYCRGAALRRHRKWK